MRLRILSFVLVTLLQRIGYRLRQLSRIRYVPGGLFDVIRNLLQKLLLYGVALARSVAPPELK